VTYTYCKKIIQAGNFEKDDMQDKLDIFLLNNRINQDQYSELVDLIK
jgi:hypothetical protein